MTLYFASEPANGASIVYRGLTSLSGRRSPLSDKGIDFNILRVSQPHTVYDLRADAIASGGGLASATLSGIRYLVESKGAVVAAAEVGLDKTTATALFLMNINFGPYVEATASALTRIPTLAPATTGSYEVRLLRFAAIYLVAIWLKADSGRADIIYPLAPAPDGLRAEHSYSPDDFIEIILPLAQELAGQRLSDSDIVTDDFMSEVLAVANRQADRSDDELLELLEYEWERAGLALADRGTGDYLRTVRDEILGIAIRERETVTVINAMIADDTLNWATQHHLASDQYTFVIGLLVAWLTRAALRRPPKPHVEDDQDEN